MMRTPDVNVSDEIFSRSKLSYLVSKLLVYGYIHSASDIFNPFYVTKEPIADEQLLY